MGDMLDKITEGQDPITRIIAKIPGFTGYIEKQNRRTAEANSGIGAGRHGPRHLGPIPRRCGANRRFQNGAASIADSRKVLLLFLPPCTQGGLRGVT